MIIKLDEKTSEKTSLTSDDDARGAFFKKIKPALEKNLSSCPSFDKLPEDFRDGFWFGAEAAVIELIDQLIDFEDGGEHFSQFIFIDDQDKNASE